MLLADLRLHAERPAAACRPSSSRRRRAGGARTAPRAAHDHRVRRRVDPDNVERLLRAPPIPSPCAARPCSRGSRGARPEPAAVSTIGPGARPRPEEQAVVPPLEEVLAFRLPARSSQPSERASSLTRALVRSPSGTAPGPAAPAEAGEKVRLVLGPVLRPQEPAGGAASSRCSRA